MTDARRENTHVQARSDREASGDVLFRGAGGRYAKLHRKKAAGNCFSTSIALRHRWSRLVRQHDLPQRLESRHRIGELNADDE